MYRLVNFFSGFSFLVFDFLIFGLFFFFNGGGLEMIGGAIGDVCGSGGDGGTALAAVRS